MNVDLVCTDDTLALYTAGMTNLQDLLPQEWDNGDRKTARPALEEALAIVLRSLGRRRPPIREADIVDPTELRTAVAYGALEILYRAAATHDDSPNVKKAADFGKLFAGELLGLQPEVTHGATAGAMSIRMSRG